MSRRTREARHSQRHEGADGSRLSAPLPSVNEHAPSPRTSFCLLEANDDDASHPSPSMATGERQPRQNRHSAARLDRRRAEQGRAAHGLGASRGGRGGGGGGSPLPSPSPGLTPLASSALLAAPSRLPLEELQDDDADLQTLFRLDHSVYTNPDNLAPSLHTSIINNESQIVGQNGVLGSLHRGKRRAIQRETSAAIGEHHNLPHSLAHSRRMSLVSSVRSQQRAISSVDTTLAGMDTETDDTADGHTMMGESPREASAVAYSDTLSSRSRSLSRTNSQARIQRGRRERRFAWWMRCWRSWWCCCFRWFPRRDQTVSPVIPHRTCREFMQSLLSRVYANWDSYFLYFTLVLAMINIPVAVIAAAVMKASSNVVYHSRCVLTSRGDQEHVVTTASLASLFIPLGNHIVLFIICLWIAILCSRSRVRVLKSSPASMTINLTSVFMLPCYELILYTMTFLHIAGIVLYTVSFYATFNGNTSTEDTDDDGFKIMRPDHSAAYPCEVVWIPFIWSLQLLPFLMSQHSVSHEAVRRCVLYSGAVCIVITALFETLYEEGSTVMNLLFIAVHGFLLCFYVWAKFASNARATFDFFFVAAFLSSTGALVVDIIGLVRPSQPEHIAVGRCVVASLDAILTVAMLLSLRADTRYWLGIDDGSTRAKNSPFKKYMRNLSERGMITNFSTRTSVYDVHRMIEEHRQSVVDFSALKLECVIAQGATSIVMRGLMRGGATIALKIYTAVQVTDEEVYRFSRETALNVQLSHPNIVKFYGLCVVPPSISLVFEFCEYGSLDVVLENNSMSTLSIKLRAWLDACRAVAYLHSFSPPLLHRDIKTDNFLVGQDFALKLADFGEANLLRPRSDGTMTIAGTVDYMAPEMILGGKTAIYDTGVDVYSLMITLWQIMVPDRSPWDGKSHLEVYTCVANGERPPLLPRIPHGCAEILEAGWVANPSKRMAVKDIINKVHQLWLLSAHQKPLKRT